MAQLGLDISNWSGEIRPSAVTCWLGNHRSFVICGTQRRDIYRQQARTVADGGLELQAYTYFYFRDDPTGQVKQALSVMDSEPRPCFWWLDFEDAPPAGWDGDLVTEWVLRAQDAAACLSPYPFGYYTGYWWIEATGIDMAALPRRPLWVARYLGGATLWDCPEVAPGWRPVMKQYTGSMSLCEVNVDLNYREAGMAEKTLTREQALAICEAEVKRIKDLWRYVAAVMGWEWPDL